MNRNVVLAAELDIKSAAVAALCKQYGVASLDLFGSGTTEQWRASDSDLDFVVTFRPDADSGIADRYFGLADALEALFERSVDLVTASSIRNPYFRASVEATRTPIYAE